MEELPLKSFHYIDQMFDVAVCAMFGSDRNLAPGQECASAAHIRAKLSKILSPDHWADYPPVIFERDFVSRHNDWRPFREVLIDVAREEEFLQRVKWFFEDYCRSDEFTLAGIEEPRTAARRFSAVNYFTISDNIRIDLEACNLYTEDVSNGGWRLIYSDLLICRTSYFAELSKILNNEGFSAPGNEPGKSVGIRQTKNTSGGQTRCEKWLTGYAEKYEKDDLEHRARTELMTEAVDLFGISKKAFDRAWFDVSQAHPKLVKPGRRRKI